MNPLDWRGPEFLALYLPLAAALVVSAWIARRLAPPGGEWERRALDPYAIAYLARGARDAARMAVVMLAHRGLLALDQDDRSPAPEAASLPLERAVLAAATARPGTPMPSALAIVQRASVDAAAQRLETPLVEAGLMPTRAWRRWYRLSLAAALVALLAFGLAKMCVAVQRGHHNVGFLFLIMLATAAAVIAIAVVGPLPSRRGRRLLADLRRLLEPRRLVPIPADADPAAALLLVAVFGVHTLRGRVGQLRRQLFPRLAGASGSSCGSSCSTWTTSCGSGSSCAGGSSSSCSSGSSCGSSCGGGGCGGCGSG